MDKKILNILFLFIIISLIFNSIPKPIQMNFIGGILGNKLSFYPFIVGFVYILYCQYKYKNALVNLDKFLKFIVLYLVITLISLLVGLYNYPYYDMVINGPVTQIEKLPKVMVFLNSLGIHIDQKILIAFWMIARVVKGLLFDSFYTFGGAYMIYCWYHNDWQKGLNIFIKGILIGLIVVLGYGCIEMLYLAGNDIAKNILITFNPYIHIIKTDHNWWPPLLWVKQTRSVFPEPSHIGNYLAFTLPVLWCLIINIRAYNELKLNKIILLCLTFIFSMIIFLAQARTASAMFFGMSALYVLLLCYLYKKDYWKNFAKIIIVSVLAFVVSLTFINNFINKPVTTKTVNNTKIETKISAKMTDQMKTNANKNGENKKIAKDKFAAKSEVQRKMQGVDNYISKNFTSLASDNQRSNGARYALIKSNLRIGMDNIFFGVGKGLTGAYVSANFTEKEKQNKEVKMWVTNQKKEGVLRYGLGAMNEYIGRFAETGIIGLIAFLCPFFYILYKLFKTLKPSSNIIQIKILLLLTSLVGVMVAGMNGSLNIFFSTWIVLGLCYAAVFDKKLDNE